MSDESSEPINLPKGDELRLWQRSFWGGTHAERASAEVLENLAGPRHESRTDLVVLGPSGAGKSALLAALRRSCEDIDPDGFELGIVPLELARLETAEAPRLRQRQPSTPTRAPQVYSFQCQLRGSARAVGVPSELEIVVRDVPGDWAFPIGGRPDGEQLRSVARNSTSLILVADAASPDIELWERNLPYLLQDLAFPGLELVWRASTVSALARRKEYPPQREPQARWPFDRVLVLLSKIDVSIESAVASAHASWGHGRVSDESVFELIGQCTPAELARRLSPLDQVREAIGLQLRALRAVLYPGAQLAVGLASAWGFRDPGPASTLTVANSEKPPWNPFGLREALWYLATGGVRYPVVEVDSNQSPEVETDWIEAVPQMTAGKGGK